jgi:IMP cyclohydrolase
MALTKVNEIKELLSSNAYPGRGIVIGKSLDGKKAAMAYFIMGRSENSRNRVFKEVKNEVTIYPFDSSKVEDPRLIIYSPIRQINNFTIVTNGDQTDTIYNYIDSGKSFEKALETRCFEPDSPNFTPRISGILDFECDSFSYKLNILKCGDTEGKQCNRFTYNYSPVNGVGHFIHTYKCDGNPIPSFEGEPEVVAIPNDIDSFANEMWSSLNQNNKISLYVRYIDLENGKTVSKLFNKNI